MRPILLKGHERSITFLKFNEDGDLLFTCAKDLSPTVWFTSDGKRLGSYDGHCGAVWELDVDRRSERLITASADADVKLWEVRTGRELASFTHSGPVRSVAFNEGETQFVTATAPFKKAKAYISIYALPADPEEEVSREPIRIIKAWESLERLTLMTARWLPLNELVVAASSEGMLHYFNPETGDEVKTVEAHKGSITCLAFDKARLMFMTSSTDMKCKLWDATSLGELKEYVTERPMNTCAISPTKDHCIMGGGQEAQSVTTTAAQSGKFEVRFWNMIFPEEIGRVKGHFGPVNTVAFFPDGMGYASGGEDGYVRLHHFDADYLRKDESAAARKLARKLGGKRAAAAAAAAAAGEDVEEKEADGAGAAASAAAE